MSSAYNRTHRDRRYERLDAAGIPDEIEG